MDAFFELMDIVEEAERSGDVVSWRYRGLDIWPIVKYALVKSLLEHRRSGLVRFPATAPPAPSPEGVRSRTRALWQRLAQTVEGRHWFETLDRPGSGRNVLAFGRGSAFVDLGGVAWNQQLDPYRIALRSLGYTVHSFWQGRPTVEPGPPCFGPEHDIDRFNLHLKQTAHRAGLERAEIVRRIPRLEAFCAALEIEPDQIHGLIDTLIGRCDAARPHLRGLVRHLRAALVVTSNYATVTGWALARECRQYGVPFVDLQHGVQGRYSGSYYWSVAPRRDWNCLPSHQISWTAEDAEHFAAGHPRRRAFAAGPASLLMADALRSESLPPALAGARVGLEAARERLSVALEGAPRPWILFAAQTDSDFALGRDLARQTTGTILFRNHPTQSLENLRRGDPEAFAALHAETATKAPLALLLEVADLVVCGYSATILEAALIGLPSFGFGAFAPILKRDYPRLLPDLLHLVDPDDLAAALARLDPPARRNAAAESVADGARIADMFREMGLQADGT